MRKCFHNFEAACMFTGGPCSDGYKGVKCEYFIEKKTGDKRIKDGYVFSIKEMKFVKRVEKNTLSDEELSDCLSDDWDD